MTKENSKTMTKENVQVPEQNMNSILVIGGYGQVGKDICKQLAPLFPGQVVVAGRRIALAEKAAAEIGHGAQGAVVDISKPDTVVFDGVLAVVVCVDQTDTLFAQECLKNGVHYIDITATYEYLAEVEKLDGLAKEHGATVLLSVGVAPGLTNMLAAHAHKELDETERIDILLEAALFDHHGKGATEWIMDNIDTEYDVATAQGPQTVKSMQDSLKFRFPGQEKEHTGYRFNFSDQHVLHKTLNVPEVNTWFRFSNRPLTWLLSKGSKAGIGKLFRKRVLHDMAVKLFTGVHVGDDSCGVAVRAVGTKAGKKTSIHVAVMGHKEALMTAICSAEMLRQVLTKPTPPGVYHAEEIVALDPLVGALQREIPDLFVQL